MKNWSIATRVTVGIALGVAMTVLVAVGGQLGLSTMSRAASHVTDRIAVLTVVGDVRAASLGVRRFEKDFIINAGDVAAQDKYATEWREEMASLRTSLERLGSFATTPDERRQAAESSAAVDRYQNGFQAVMAAARADRSLPAGRLNQLIAPVKDEIRHVIAAADRMAEVRDREIHDEVVAAEATQRRITVLLYSALAAALAIGLAVVVVVARSVTATIRALASESERLTEAAVHGALGVRARAESVSGEFRSVVLGMNKTMDAFAKPIQVTAEYVDRISKGDLPPKITDHYEGDFDLIKQNLNTCIDAVGALVQDSLALSQAAVEGKLSTRADASRHKGDYQRIVAGVNQTLDAVLGPINEAAQVLEKLAQRDLRARVQGNYQGDHAKIKEALNSTAEALHEAISQVAQAVGQVSAAAGQIASASESVATGASEQSSSLEETSSSLESMASMTRQAADNAQQANALAQEANRAATEGSAAVEQMTGAMGKIKASAEGTSQIIKDINEIAFQTNLLALNAAVEAARAGEAGRGFAVVAEEVRSLALRSKEAANRTEELIRESVKQAGEGEVTATHVSDQLGAIAASVSKVSGIVAEIAASAKEQATGIEQVSRAVEQVGQVTQQNAANSEESSSAAVELSGQSEELAAMVGTFRVQVSATPRPAALAAPKPVAKPSRVRPQKTNQGGKSGRPSTIALSPEEILPLDGEPAFKEF